jgi:hypothetical protein
MNIDYNLIILYYFCTSFKNKENLQKIRYGKV